MRPAPVSGPIAGLRALYAWLFALLLSGFSYADDLSAALEIGVGHSSTSKATTESNIHYVWSSSWLSDLPATGFSLSSSTTFNNKLDPNNYLVTMRIVVSYQGFVLRAGPCYLKNPNAPATEGYVSLSWRTKYSHVHEYVDGKFADLNVFLGYRFSGIPITVGVSHLVGDAFNSKISRDVLSVGYRF